MPFASACRGQRRQAALSTHAGRAGVVLALPSALALAAKRARPLSPLAGHVLAGQGTTLLKPRGYLVVGVIGAQGDGGDPVTNAVAAVTAQGFSYFQHVVALLRPDMGGHQAAAAEGRDVAHADLLVFERRAS